MRKLIWNNIDLCVGCNRCTRNCPVETANVTFKDEEDNIKVRIDERSCIACGACISSCQHGSRGYEDDTEKFFEDLRRGVDISLFAAPAARSNFDHFGRMLTWLRQLGVKKIYDVSLGADICTWAHIRVIQKNNPASVITQPCPAIVNYCLMHQPDLLKNLSPVHSPMLCTAVYMKQYERIGDRIAGLSPCIAKAHEFEATGLVQYNVTFAKLQEYIERNNISLPREETDFDHYQSGLGSIYSMPGGLKENVEFFLGKALRVDKSEGPKIVYKALDEFVNQPASKLPAIFDVLNCQEGCNLGSACRHDKGVFDVNTTMEECRQKASEGRDKEYFDELYAMYDRELDLKHFLRSYTPQRANIPSVTNYQIEEAFHMMDKDTETEKNFNCGACGSSTCTEMARKIALGVNVVENCIQKSRDEIKEEHRHTLAVQKNNMENVSQITKDIETIREFSATILDNIGGVNESIAEYANMASAIDNIAMHINIISLNASVEAARAGEHGKTFAVVAEEIRRLAQTSKETVSRTEKVSEVATNSVTKMNDGIQKIKTAVDAAHQNIGIITENSNKIIN